MRSILMLIALLALAESAFAVKPDQRLASDGVLLIDQTCAVNTGCFEGDTAGYPVTISVPGSYALHSTLIVPNENTDGIVVSANDVGIDLNNFAIIGSGCVSTIFDCTPTAGNGSGVVSDSDKYGILVKNGSVTGMGAQGVRLGNQAIVSNLRLRWNRLDAIWVGNGSIISGNAVLENGRIGIISSGRGSIISDNTVIQNGHHGIYLSSLGIVQKNVLERNGWAEPLNQYDIPYGLRLGGGTAYSENAINRAFDDDGILSGFVCGGVSVGSNVCETSICDSITPNCP